MSEAVEHVVTGPTVCVDFKNPKAYLALRPTLALEVELGTTFDWLPLIVSPLSRPQPELDSEDRGARHRRIRAQYYERDLRRYAGVYGMELGDLYRNPDVSLASIGLLWARRHSAAAVRAYLHAVFDGYWRDNLDIESATAIARLLAESGADIAGWAGYSTGTGRGQLEQTTAALRGAGLFDVPAYVVEGETLFGRQHLPMVGWLLSGRTGEPPI